MKSPFLPSTVFGVSNVPHHACSMYFVWENCRPVLEMLTTRHGPKKAHDPKKADS